MYQNSKEGKTLNVIPWWNGLFNVQMIWNHILLRECQCQYRIT